MVLNKLVEVSAVILVVRFGFNMLANALTGLNDVEPELASKNYFK